MRSSRQPNLMTNRLSHFQCSYCVIRMNQELDANVILV